MRILLQVNALFFCNVATNIDGLPFAVESVGLNIVSVEKVYATAVVDDAMTHVAIPY